MDKYYDTPENDSVTLTFQSFIFAGDFNLFAGRLKRKLLVVLASVHLSGLRGSEY